MQQRILGKYISILHRHKQRYINQRLREDGLGYAGYNFLLYIQKNEGCSQKDMCCDLALDEAMATRKMNQMEGEGYLRRKKEGREYALYLDQRGREILPQVYEVLNDWWNYLLDGIPEKEIVQLQARLEQMAERAKQIAAGKEEM